MLPTLCLCLGIIKQRLAPQNGVVDFAEVVESLMNVKTKTSCQGLSTTHVSLNPELDASRSTSA